MSVGITWPDLLVLGIVALAAIKGFSRGFVSEIAGAAAIVFAFVTPWWYSGAADPQIEQWFHVAPGVAHIIGMILTGIATYAIVMAAAWILNRFAKLPIVNIGNALGGAAVGAIKSIVVVWLILFIVLFFPIPASIRHDLHRSALVGFITGPNSTVDGLIENALPSFARPFVDPYLSGRHSTP